MKNLRRSEIGYFGIKERKTIKTRWEYLYIGYLKRSAYVKRVGDLHNTSQACIRRRRKFMVGLSLGN